MLKDQIVWTAKENPYNKDILEVNGKLIIEQTQGITKSFFKDAKIDIMEEAKARINYVIWHRLYGQIHMDIQDIYYETGGSQKVRDLLKRIENI